MTTSRVIRGTRAKVFLYLCGILIIVGIIACYNNTLSHLDDVKKSNFICHQQEENLSTQLQVISDYKQRLEKTLKTEQADHVQTKANLENQLKEERSKYENEATDMKHKLESVQQHLNLLQTQYDDYKEETDKGQKQQQEEINNLEARISELLEEEKKLRSSRESLKTQYTELQSEKEKLAKELENQNKNSNDQELSKLNKENKELKDEVEHLKAKCNNQETLVEPNVQQVEDTNKNLETHDSNKDEKIAHQEPDTGAGNAPLFVLAQPYANDNKVVSSSTSSNNVLKPSQASLDGARPILVPTLTPVSVRKDNKVPEGVVAIPEKKEDEVVNARYQNARESANELVPQAEKAAKDEIEKENVAHEVFDAPLFHDGLQFDNDNFKQVDKPNFDKRHIDTLGAPKDKKNQEDQGDYKDQNDVQLEENDDDDGDGYDDHLARQKEPAVRN
ncbi:glutamic acid-rich protein isoform X1 [Diabrotica virgifera virgifera]|uniref:Glutamic acid-rich protein-like isoform X1 n=1 Tax=Diabrotica virgifera virgifera TaxID=50390 RepID=A0A6P7EY59_DIAVI|nr:glutamic acid-rich protein isoform X1 [Diabrotica virgifera virgifera]